LPKPRCEILCARDGTTSLEYAILGALIAAVLVGAINTYGAGVKSFFTLAAHIAVSG
jgi:Flp pilus assembly pilin Flp